MANIAVIGTGSVGRTLGAKWAQVGRQVIFGSRDPGSQPLQDLLKTTAGNARADSISAAIQAGEIILFAVPWGSVPGLVMENAESLKQKIAIDATNNFGASVINNLAAFQEAGLSSGYYRAFNSLGWNIFDRPQLNKIQADHFFTGPDGQGRETVAGLIEDIGLRPVWVGENDQIQIVDQLAALWVALAHRRGWGREIALKVIDRNPFPPEFWQIQ